MKTLLLTMREGLYYFDRIKGEELRTEALFRPMNGLENFVFRVMRRLGSAWTRLFYGKWYADLASYDKIIVLDNVCLLDGKLLRNIAKRAPHTPKYLYYWNIIRDEERYKRTRALADRYGFKVYSYDCGDCEKYDMYFNTIMYDKTLSLDEREYKNDCLFLGFIKDRAEGMLSLYTAIERAGFSPRFVTVKNNGSDPKLPFEYRETYVNYYEYLDMLAESRAILDIAQKGQDGYSMRVMEAIFFDKKLITTNRYVLKAPFYRRENILFIEPDKTTEEEITEFYNLPMQPYSKALKEYYSVEKWAERFDA